MPRSDASEVAAGMKAEGFGVTVRRGCVSFRSATDSAAIEAAVRAISRDALSIYAIEPVLARLAPTGITTNSKSRYAEGVCYRPRTWGRS